MSISLAKAIWDELKPYISTVDRAEAADLFVNTLIDHDIDPEVIVQGFRGDKEIRNAVNANVMETPEEEEDEDEDWGNDDEYEYDED